VLNGVCGIPSILYLKVYGGLPLIPVRVTLWLIEFTHTDEGPVMVAEIVAGLCSLTGSRYPGLKHSLS